MLNIINICPWGPIVAFSSTRVSVTFMLCFVFSWSCSKYGVFGRNRPVIGNKEQWLLQLVSKFTNEGNAFRRLSEANSRNNFWGRGENKAALLRQRRDQGGFVEDKAKYEAENSRLRRVRGSKNSASRSLKARQWPRGLHHVLFIMLVIIYTVRYTDADIRGVCTYIRNIQLSWVVCSFCRCGLKIGPVQRNPAQ